MSSSERPICLTLAHTGFMVSSNDLSIIFLRTTMSSMAIARIFSLFFRLAALRLFAGITTCPLEETLVVDASTMLSPRVVRIFTYNNIAKIALLYRWLLDPRITGNWVVSMLKKKAFFQFKYLPCFLLVVKIFNIFHLLFP